jgi:uncharacterized protein YkwD
MRRWPKAIAVGIVAASLVTLQPAEAQAVTRRKACVQEINAIRNAHDLQPVTLVRDLSDYAQKHSQQMSSDGSLWHSNLTAVLKPYDWSQGGENIAYGDSIEQIHDMFMESGPHRDNILNPKFKRVGCGGVQSDGWLWLTEVFYG